MENLLFLGVPILKHIRVNGFTLRGNALAIFVCPFNRDEFLKKIFAPLKQSRFSVKLGCTHTP